MNRRKTAIFGAAAMISLGASATAARAWDSEETYKSLQNAVSKIPVIGSSLPAGLSAAIKPTHSYLTEEAIGLAQGTFPELATPANRKALLDGANSEYHELPNTVGNVSGKALRPYYVKLASDYGIDPEALRLKHFGTNEGSNDMPGWWQEALAAKRAGNERKAFYFVGVLLHNIEDMGVPAHSHKLKHQGNLTEFDAVEAVATFTPYDFATLSSTSYPDGMTGPSLTFPFVPTVIMNPLTRPTITRSDPKFPDPSRYYDYSAGWTRADAPGYTSVKLSFLTSPFDTWKKRIQLIADRRTRTARVCEWTLRSACATLRTTTSGGRPPIRIFR